MLCAFKGANLTKIFYMRNIPQRSMRFESIGYAAHLAIEGHGGG